MVGSSGKCEPVRILGELHTLPTVGGVQRVVRGTSENISFNKQLTVLEKWINVQIFIVVIRVDIFWAAMVRVILWITQGRSSGKNVCRCLYFQCCRLVVQNCCLVVQNSCLVVANSVAGVLARNCEGLTSWGSLVPKGPNAAVWQSVLLRKEAIGLKW